MKVMQIEVPDQLADEIDNLVKAGWFTSEGELARLALTDFIRRHRFELLEQFQREDIAWALQQKGAET
jgi:Arc/MetJ-type ribon-helix-helix transcriptional regulator